MIPTALFVLGAITPIDLGKKQIEQNRYKDAIETLQAVENNPKGLRLLAEAYYKDQEYAKAFNVFLKALEYSAAKPYERSKEESKLYEDALQVYLDPSERDLPTIAVKIRDLYGGIWSLHPDYAELGYLVAIAHANLGDYPQFFEVFFRSYQEFPDHFLAYKTKAILSIKLYEREKLPKDKENRKEEIVYFVRKAKALYPKDPALYRMEIAFSKEKSESIDVNLKEILDKDIVIPRDDLSFYIDTLLAYGKNELAEAFLLKARKWYPYSRTLDAANQLISEKKKNHK